MNKNILICLFLILNLLTSAIHAQEVTPDYAVFKMELALSHLMVDVADSLDGKTPEGTNPFENPEKLQSLLREEAKKFEAFYERSGLIPDEKIPAFRNFVSSFKWDNIVLHMKRAHLGIDVFLKRKGYGFALSVMAGKAFKMGLMWFCMHHHLEAALPVIMTVPWLVLATSIPSKWQNRQIENDLKTVLGSESAVNAYREQEKMFLKVYHLSSDKDFFLPLETMEDTNISAVIIKNNGKMKRLLNLIGMNEDELTLINLKKFLKNQSFSSGYINWILKNKSLDDQAKVALISFSLIESEDLKLKFQLQFQSQFRTFKSNGRWEKILSWAQVMNQVQDVDELIKGLESLPEGLQAREAALVWSDLLFPEYLQKLNLTHKEGRELVLKSEGLKARLLTLPETASTDEIKSEFTTFIGKVLSDKPGKRCQTPASVIGAKLLEGL